MFGDQQWAWLQAYNVTGYIQAALMLGYNTTSVGRVVLAPSRTKPIQLEAHARPTPLLNAFIVILRALPQIRLAASFDSQSFKSHLRRISLDFT